jgi:hypothetical protein
MQKRGTSGPKSTLPTRNRILLLCLMFYPYTMVEDNLKTLANPIHLSHSSQSRHLSLIEKTKITV